MTTLTFPEDFRWGVATAAAQVEGGAYEGGKAASIWDVHCQTPGAIIDGSTIDVACDHLHRMKEDVALMKDLGVGTYRFSVSWARVMPDGHTLNEEGLAFYSDLIDELGAAGIKPWLTLYHWDLPQVVQDEGGWTNRHTAELFADYAAAVYDRFGPRVDVWTTLNEPWCSSFLSYACGEHAPGHTSPDEAVAAAHHLLLAHGLATRAIDALANEKGEKPTRGITLNFTVAHPADPESEGDKDAARRINGLHNRIFLDPIFRGEYPADVVEDMRLEADIMQYVRPGDMEIIHVPIDVLGVNFYNGMAVAAPEGGYRKSVPAPNAQGVLRSSPEVGSSSVRVVSRNLPLTDMGWEVDAHDLYLLLTYLHREYTEPAGADLVVTENGAAYPDAADEHDYVDDSHDRLVYIRDHLAAVHQAIDEGARVRGYLEWSLMDNFEWALGYSKRFGIVRVNYDTLERVPKASALWYRDVMRTGTLEIPDAQE